MKMYWTALFLVFSSTFLGAQDFDPRIVNKAYPVLWQQTAAEYRALCYQAYNLAKLRLDAIPKKQLRKEQLAIVTDLDETILNNSYAEAQLLKEGKSFNDATWKNWISKSAATGVPGAAEFLRYAKHLGLTIFYISNRDTGDVLYTLENLKRLNLPDADTSHMLFQSNTSSKETRRQKVMTQYKIVMLLGDNLNDFTSAFEKKNFADRFAETDKVKEEWGNKFIVLPNSDYGEWEGALYNYQHHLSPEQKWNMLLQNLTGYNDK
jgi:5'-nucleotidase (lipoprotein e(P4) family)